MVIGLSLFSAPTQAPTILNTDRIIIIQGNTLKSTPALPLKIGVYGVLGVMVGYYDLISQYDWDTEIAYQILMCESSGNFEAHRFSHKTKDDSWGLFQINLYGELAEKRPSPEWLKIPENNVAYAYKLYLENGWKHWKNCYRKVAAY